MYQSGTAVADDGREQDVEYELCEHQETIRTPTLDDPNASIPGLKTLSGRMKPACFSDQGQFTLVTKQGQKYRITGRGWTSGHVEFVATPIS
jgi:hypothetical protein